IALAEEGLVWFDSVARDWQWDIERIRAKGFTDNVIDLLAGKLDRLPAGTRQVLRPFAIGRQQRCRVIARDVIAGDREEAPRRSCVAGGPRMTAMSQPRAALGRHLERPGAVVGRGGPKGFRQGQAAPGTA